MSQCNLSCKIVKNCRTNLQICKSKNLQIKTAKQILSEVCMIKKKKKQRLIVLFTSEVMYKSILTRLVYTPPDLSPRFTCIKSKLVETGLISYFGLPFRQRNATCKFLATTEDYRVLNNIKFRGCPIIHSLSNGVVGETMN